MRIYLIRHAAAVARSEKIAEEYRYLTIRGRRSFRLNAKRMAKRGDAPDVILSSPLARALQTAEILAEALAFEGEVIVSPEAGPGFDKAALRRLLAQFKGKRALAVVGHEPDMGSVAGALLGSAQPLSMKKGMVACLKVPADKKSKSSLKWLLFEGKKVDYSAPA